MEILKVDRLSFAYAGMERQALKDVSFALESGSFTVLTGDSGSGKSTLLRLLKREIAPRAARSLSAVKSRMRFPTVRLQARSGLSPSTPTSRSSPTACGMSWRLGWKVSEKTSR